MMPMQFKENNAIYLQIADRLCDEMLAGKYKPEERIPSVREIGAALEVNPNTVMRSFDFLQMHGIIFNKRGVGYFVASDALETIRKMRRETFMNEIVPDVYKQMELLGISLDEVVDMFKSYAEREPAEQ